MTSYVGRFAPSPTGLLHLGSLIGALASFLDARASGGQWLLRIEDLDPPRETAGAAEAIMQSLRDHGMQWDRDVMWQSQRREAYEQALCRLFDQCVAFYCTCSRTDLQAYDGIYPGTCRGCCQRPAGDFAIRVQVPDRIVAFEDTVQGQYQQALQRDVGDFVLRRKDGLFAYQLAVVVDDAAQGVTHVVRGSDLLDSTPRQIWLQQQLGLTTPRYAHIPVITNAQGQKLSKQTFAPALDAGRAAENLRAALTFLRQPLPPLNSAVAEIIAYAIEHWCLRRVPRCLTMMDSSHAN